ncbi:MAG: hypothetical protein K2L21_05525, partial [Muribaculaceae bacterium]|nr:hypothetical protein [Muribaculaceae bacterium]
DADALRQIMGATVTETEKLHKSFINYAAIGNTINHVVNAIGEIHQVLGELTGAYTAQIEAETKLAVNMRNTMSATEEEIQSIKNLCAAQQELGVVGDEVQLAGAQELATYLSQKESLEQLIPVMNDMLVQQYGMNASQENAAQIATMLGKVMDGQTGALKRYGYTFDEAQEQILKYGDEAQRAAVLCDVVSASVGGMNAEMAKTDAGKMQQTANWIGDVKEKLGGLAQAVMPYLTMAYEAAIATGGVLKIIAAIKTLIGPIRTWWASQRQVNSELSKTSVVANAAAQSTATMGTSAKTAGVAVRSFSMGMRSLLVVSGIGIAIAALSTAFDLFSSKAGDAAEASEKLAEAQDKAKQASMEREQQQRAENSEIANARALLDIHIAKLKEFHGSKAQEKKLVTEMNNTYGETMGYYKTTSEWYETLKKNSEAYCRQLVLEARIRALATRLGEKEQRLVDMGGTVPAPSGASAPAPEQPASPAKDLAPTPAPAPVTSKSERSNFPAAETLLNNSRGNSRRMSLNMQQQVEAAAESMPPVTVPARVLPEIKAEDTKKAMQSILEKEIEKDTAQLNDLTLELAGISFDKSGSTGAPGNNEPKWTEDAKTLEDYTNNLSWLDSQLKKVSIDDKEQIEDLKKKREFTEQYIAVLREQLGLQQRAGKDRGRRAGEEVKQLEAPKSLLPAIPTIDPSAIVPESGPFDMAGEAIDRYIKKLEGLRTQQELVCGALANVGSAMSSMGDVVGEGAGAWLEYGAKVVGAVSQVLPQILALTSAQWAEALSGVSSSAAALPPPFNIIAIGAGVTAVLAAMAAVPKFADGGIAYGPTLGIFGEYAGASHNPEVVAPLNKLRDLLQPAYGFGTNEVRLRIKGRDLVGLITLENNLKNRS